MFRSAWVSFIAENLAPKGTLFSRDDLSLRQIQFCSVTREHPYLRTYMNMTHLSWLLIPLAVLIGAVLPIQGALLSKLGPLLNHPIQATLVSYIGGAFVCVLILSFSRTAYPSLGELSAIDWHLYTAGFLGAIFVSGMLYLMPVVGVANMLAAAIVGQLVASIMIDHFGLLGGLRIGVSPSRIFGMVLLFIGLYFIQRKTL